jgi:major type 1 subunit fimbrin (pilin)/fimbrial protein
MYNLKTSLLALSLGLAASLAGTSVFANTGTINFEGMITSSTCPIEIISPGDEHPSNLVKMGSIDVKRFTAIGQEHDGKQFALRIPDRAGCSLTGTGAKVTFNGTADTTAPEYFAVTPTADGAKNVVIVLRDRTGASIDPGSASATYPLNASGKTDMVFNAYYRSTAVPVVAGAASADVHFIVDIN